MPSVNPPPVYPPSPYSPQTTPAYSAQPLPTNLGNSATTAIGGKPFTNSEDRAQITSDGEKVTVTSTQGNTISYISPSDSYALQRSDGEFLGSLGNNTIGVDEGNTEIAVDQQGQVHALTPDGKWMNLGALQSASTQQSLSRMIDPTAENDLLNVSSHKGSLGYLNMANMGFAPSSVQVLNVAQVQKANERVNTQQAAQTAATAKANALAASYAPPILISPTDQIMPNPVMPPAVSI